MILYIIINHITELIMKFIIAEIIYNIILIYFLLISLLQLIVNLLKSVIRLHKCKI